MKYEIKVVCQSERSKLTKSAETEEMETAAKRHDASNSTKELQPELSRADDSLELQSAGDEGRGLQMMREEQVHGETVY